MKSEVTKRVEHETKTTTVIAQTLECSYGDASGFMDANHYFWMDAYEKGLSPKKSAKFILKSVSEL